RDDLVTGVQTCALPISSMFKRLVRCAIAGGRLAPDAVALATDDGLIHELMGDDPTGLARALRERRLAKRALDLPATDLPAATPRSEERRVGKGGGAGGA